MGRVCFDFDGVIHSYTSGFLGDGNIPDPPVPGIKQVIDRLRDAGYRVVVLSSRSASSEGRRAMQEWFDKWDIEVDDICSTKPPARCYVDDRAVLFTGDTSTLFDTIDNFEPYWRDTPEYRGTRDTDPPPRFFMGAVTGDIIGSVYEFDNIHTEDFPLFANDCDITDDTVMTLAVAQSFMDFYKVGDGIGLTDVIRDNLRKFGRHYPAMTYGGRFRDWLWSGTKEPANSWGNGAPMRCSAAGWLASSLEDAYNFGMLTAAPSHNHPEAMNAAGTVAELIFLGLEGTKMSEMKVQAACRGYHLPSIEWLRENNSFSERSADTMSAALGCFFASDSFEDCIRKAISIGGDSDTIAAIAGSIAEAHFGIPDDIRRKAWAYIPTKLRKVILDFNSFLCME